jgi:hypothetical protein
MRVMRRISSSVTIGLLAKPQTPLWITRTPKPAASLAAGAGARAAPKPLRRAATAAPAPAARRARRRSGRAPRLRGCCCREALTPRFVLRVKRMSAYVQPAFFASARAMSEPLELRVEDTPLRRLREEVGDEVAGGERDARAANGLDEISAILSPGEYRPSMPWRPGRFPRTP